MKRTSLCDMRDRRVRTTATVITRSREMILERFLPFFAETAEVDAGVDLMLRHIPVIANGRAVVRSRGTASVM